MNDIWGGWIMLKYSRETSKIKSVAMKYASEKYNIDFSDCEIFVEDDGAFWVVIINSNTQSIGYIQLIIKKRFSKVIKCFNFKQSNY